jgi:hypothetical protein
MRPYASRFLSREFGLGSHLVIYSRARRVFYREFGLAPLASNAANGCSAALE